MDIKVLFDEDTISSDFETSLGLSLLIDGSVIFDTGSNGDKLIHNLKAMNINTDSITDIVLSHHHWDHIGG